MINGLWIGTVIYAIVIVIALIVAGVLGCIAIRNESRGNEDAE